MRSVDNWIDRFCRKHPNLAVPRLIQYVLMGTVIVFVFDLFSAHALSGLLSFVPSEIFRGQIWRLVTFVLVPSDARPIFFALQIYFIWWISGMVEREWGATKTTLFYCTGVMMNILVGLLTGAFFSLLGLPAGVATAGVGYLHMTLLFAFATLFPNVQVLLFMIIPIRVKWLGWFTAAVLAYGIFSGFFNAVSFEGLALGLLLGLVQAIPAVLALANYFLFFWSDIMHFLRRGRHTVRHRTSPQTIQFKKAVKAAKDQKKFLHKCAVCGRTDTENPGLEFRYCSRCNGYHCYCMEHIGNHTHVES